MRRSILCSMIMIIAVAGVFAQSDRWEDSLARLVETSHAAGLPVEPLENKIREGRAKRRTSEEIYAAVRTRKELLTRIQEEHQGSVPGGYIRELFVREQTAQQHPVMQVHTPDSRPMEQPARSVGASRNAADKAGNKHPATEPDKTAGKTPDVQKQVEKTEDKTAAKIEKSERIIQKTMDKADRKMEKRMESMEKRMEKQTQKRNKFGK